MANKKYLTSQRARSTFPFNNPVHTDDYSVGGQLFNSLGVGLDQAHQIVQREASKSFITTANTLDIDVFYSVELGDDFSFNVVKGIHDSDREYQLPTVTGEIYDPVTSGYQSYPITTASNNDIESFWYSSYPTRLEVLSGNITYNHELLSTALSGYTNTITSGVMPYPTTIDIWVDGIEESFKTNMVTSTTGDILTKAQLIGTNAGGAMIREEISLYRNGLFRSSHAYKTLESVRVLHFTSEDQQPDIIVQAPLMVQANDTNVPCNYTWYDYVMPDQRYAEKIPITLVNNGTNSYLEYYAFPAARKEDMVELYVSPNPSDMSRYYVKTLLDTNGLAIDAKAFCISKEYERILVVDDTKLYVYDLSPQISDAANLTQTANTDEITIAIEPVSAAPGDTVNVSAWRSTVHRWPVLYRGYITDPNDNYYTINQNGTITSSSTIPDWEQFNETNNHGPLFPTLSLTPNTLGTYLVTIELKYDDASSTQKVRPLAVLAESPLAELTMPSDVIGSSGTNTLTHIGIDDAQNIWVRTIDGKYHVLRLLKDYAMWDFNGKILYLKEKYDRIQISY